MTSSPPRHLVAWLASVAAARPTAPALVSESRVTTYAELWSRAGGIAKHLLQDPRVEHRSRVGIIGTNEPAYIETFLGILRAGMVAVPLNPMLDVPSLLAQLTVVEASAVVIGDVTADVADGLAANGHTLDLGQLRTDSTPTSSGARLPGIQPSSPAAIIPTSGSTGLPRGVLHTHATLLHCALQLSSAMPFRPDDRNVAFLPFFAAIPEQVLPTLCTGGSVDVVRRFDVELVADVCRRATCFDAIPTIMARLLDEAPLDALAGLRRVYFASEPMPPAVLSRWHESLPMVETHQFYGMTELVPGTSASHAMLLADPTTVGVPFPTTSLSKHAETGELLLRSPAQMRGYYNDPEASADALGPNGALKTGDLGEVDERGWLHLTGRLKDCIISGGLNIAPIEIEAFACNHPAVSAAAVVGIPDARWGETPVVIGVARNGSPLSPDILLKHCRTGLKGFKRPSAAGVVDMLPMTGIGKVAKQALRDKVLAGEIDLVRSE